METMWLLLLCCVLSTFHSSFCQTCGCTSGNSVNVRDEPCGNVIGSATSGDCFLSSTNEIGCWLGNTYYDYVEIDFWGTPAWMAKDYFQYDGMEKCAACGEFGNPAVEFRSYFLTTVWNIDWPLSGWDSVSKQQSDLIHHLDTAEELKLNAIVFQVRGCGEAMYDSSIEPWSQYLVGVQGNEPSPYWDPLEFIIDEAHNRGMELHAWLNPYRGHTSKSWGDLHSSHMCLTQPTADYCYEYSNYLWMDPGAQVVVDHLEDVIGDILARYNVDGILFDDYFYPYPDGTDFPDSATYNDYLNGGGSMSKDDWRRDNVNGMVESVYDLVNGAGRKFIISPFGLYRPCHPDGMPCHITGTDPYTEQYADTKLWLQEGWLDAMSPQLYWSIDSSGQPYEDLLQWWVHTTTNTKARHIYAANGVYKMMDSNNWPVSEIENQVCISRKYQSDISLGNIHYSAQYFRDNAKGIQDAFVNGIYSTLATIPQMDWLNIKKTSRPVGVKAERGMMTWDEPTEGSSWHWTIIFAQQEESWQVVKILPAHVTSWKPQAPSTYAISAANRAWVQSERTVVVIG